MFMLQNCNIAAKHSIFQISKLSANRVSNKSHIRLLEIGNYYIRRVHYHRKQQHEFITNRITIKIIGDTHTRKLIFLIKTAKTGKITNENTTTTSATTQTNEKNAYHCLTINIYPLSNRRWEIIQMLFTFHSAVIIGGSCERYSPINAVECMRDEIWAHFSNKPFYVLIISPFTKWLHFCQLFLSAFFFLVSCWMCENHSPNSQQNRTR